MLRQWNFRDYYHPNLTEGEKEHLESHIGMYAPSPHSLKTSIPISSVGSSRLLTFTTRRSLLRNATTVRSMSCRRLSYNF